MINQYFFNPQDRLSEYILPCILVFNNIVKDLWIDIWKHRSKIITLISTHVHGTSASNWGKIRKTLLYQDDKLTIRKEVNKKGTKAFKGKLEKINTDC